MCLARPQQTHLGAQSRPQLIGLDSCDGRGTRRSPSKHEMRLKKLLEKDRACGLEGGGKEESVDREAKSAVLMPERLPSLLLGCWAAHLWIVSFLRPELCCQYAPAGDAAAD